LRALATLEAVTCRNDGPIRERPVLGLGVQQCIGCDPIEIPLHDGCQHLLDRGVLTGHGSFQNTGGSVDIAAPLTEVEQSPRQRSVQGGRRIRGGLSTRIEPR
jgi:hypothetical protein